MVEEPTEENLPESDTTAAGDFEPQQMQTKGWVLHCSKKKASNPYIRRIAFTE